MKSMHIAGKLIVLSIALLFGGCSDKKGEQLIKKGEQLEALARYDEALTNYLASISLGRHEAYLKIANVKMAQIRYSIPRHTDYLHSSYRHFLKTAKPDAEIAQNCCSLAKEAGCTNGLQAAIERVSSCKAMIAGIEAKVSMAEQKELARREAERIAKEEEAERKARKKELDSSIEHCICNNIPLSEELMREVIRCMTYEMADTGNPEHDKSIYDETRARYEGRYITAAGTINRINSVFFDTKLNVSIDGGSVLAVFRNMPRRKKKDLKIGDVIVFRGKISSCNNTEDSFDMNNCTLMEKATPTD